MACWRRAAAVDLRNHAAALAMRAAAVVRRAWPFGEGFCGCITAGQVSGIARAVSLLPGHPDQGRAAYPELAADLDVLDREVTPVFTECDLAALRAQNRYRRQQVLILLGAALVTGLGGLQAVFPAQRWPGFLLAVLGAALAASTRFARESESQEKYLSARVKAERLRGLYFLYLSATGRYAGPGREAACPTR
jgi:Protein of unknown function (DUF4231)